MKDNTKLKYNGFAIEQAKRLLSSTSRALVRDIREIDALAQEGCASNDDLDAMADMQEELKVYGALMDTLAVMAVQYDEEEGGAVFC